MVYILFMSALRNRLQKMNMNSMRKQLLQQETALVLERYSII